MAFNGRSWLDDVSFFCWLVVASLLVVAGAAALVGGLWNSNDNLSGSQGWRMFGCIVVGLVAGMLIGQITEFCTSYSYHPTRSIAQAGTTGPATVIIQGMGIGMISTVGPVIVLVSTILACNALSGQYGVSLAAVGMLSTLGVTLATDAYGPIADNAGGIAEMAELDESVRSTTDALDALGNTTAATGKGFAIGSAVLTAASLLAAFQDAALVSATGVLSTSVTDSVILAGILFGAMLPFLFAALTMLSVQKAAGAIINEVRRQFRSTPGLLEGRPGVEPDYLQCIRISTKASIQEMVLPGTYAVMSPLLVGFLIGPRCLAGMFVGAIASGAMLAIMMANAGGAWDNAKKFIELEKAYGGKVYDQ